MKALGVAIFLVLVALPLSSSDAYVQELSSVLVHRVLIIRNYYTDTQLTFDSNGQLVPKGTRGFGPSDGRIYVQQIQL